MPAIGPRWTVHGTQGSFIKHGLDTQEDALKTGRRPQLLDLQDWGLDPHPGELLKQLPQAASFEAVRRSAANLPGNYLLYYANLRDHLQGAAPLEVTPTQVRQVMQLLTLGEQSAAQGRYVSVPA